MIGIMQSGKKYGLVGGRLGIYEVGYNHFTDFAESSFHTNCAYPLGIWASIPNVLLIIGMTIACKQVPRPA